MTPDPLSKPPSVEPATSATPPPNPRIATAASPCAPVRPVAGLETWPLFCERCGHTLVGLPHARCGGCGILHFACPECGGRQPLNTVRPAAQRIAARVRSFFLMGTLLLRVGLLLAAFASAMALGYEASYEYRSLTNVRSRPQPMPQPGWTYGYGPRPFRWDEGEVAGVVFAAAVGLAGRMMLLRFRAGWLPALGLAIWVVGGVALGTHMRAQLLDGRATANMMVVPPWADSWFERAAWIAGTTWVAAMLAWPLWVGMVRLFLVPRLADPLLSWMRQESPPAEPDFRPEPVAARSGG